MSGGVRLEMISYAALQGGGPFLLCLTLCTPAHQIYVGTQRSSTCLHAGGSNEGGREPEEEGMWLALSQIQEWIVEYGCDMLFITFRTDVAWYRLSK